MVTLVGVLVGLPLIAVLLMVWFFTEAKSVIESKRRAIASELPRLLATDEAQAAALLNHSIFARPEGDDAGWILNHRLSWPNRRGTLVPDKYVAALRTAGANWPSVARTEFEGCDTQWLTELRAYSRWSLTPGPRSAYAPGPRNDFGFPEFLELQHAVKIHLVLASDRAQAAYDVRHLARLFMTQEYMLCTMLGFAMLAIEEKFWKDSGKKWIAPPLDEVEREFLRSHIFTVVFALNPLADPSLTASVIENSPSFRRRLLMTEQTFSTRRTELPQTIGFGFENARWEVAHPYAEASEGRTNILSEPARLGGLLVKQFARARYEAIVPSLEAADALPAAGRWDSRRSELQDRL